MTDKMEKHDEKVSTEGTGKRKRAWSFDDPRFKMSPEEIEELNRRYRGTYQVTIRPKKEG